MHYEFNTLKARFRSLIAIIHHNFCVMEKLHAERFVTNFIWLVAKLSPSGHTILA